MTRSGKEGVSSDSRSWPGGRGRGRGRGVESVCDADQAFEWGAPVPGSETPDCSPPDMECGSEEPAHYGRTRLSSQSTGLQEGQVLTPVPTIPIPRSRRSASKSSIVRESSQEEKSGSIFSFSVMCKVLTISVWIRVTALTYAHTRAHTYIHFHTNTQNLCPVMVSTLSQERPGTLPIRMWMIGSRPEHCR